MGKTLSNPWKTILAMNPDTEVWWDSSPLVWPIFRDEFLNGKLPEQERTWYERELDGMFGDAPVADWLFRGCTTNPPLSWAVLKTRKEEWAAVEALWAPVRDRQDRELQRLRREKENL